MIHFERFKLENGLTVLFHKEASTPMAVVNLLYDVGARDESEEKTGFAHLFEHLMFGGSVNIPDFDGPLQAAGGESNAFTSNDITNYYDVLPAHNLDTALWLESDRMLSLAFTDKSLEVQRNVVIEEFKQRYLNQPYGDVWLELRPLAYTKHPYKWATIGKEIKHIEDAKMSDVKAFFKKHYHPSNCILCVIGNFELDYVKERVDHFFGSIPKAKKSARILPLEPAQDRFKSKTIVRNVPADAFYYAFKMPERKNPGYYLADLLSDIMGREKVSKMYVDLIKKQKLVSEINAYITGSMDEGLFIITGKLNEGKTFADLDKEIWKIIAHYKTTLISKKELEQIKIKLRTARAFQDQGLLNRAMNLSFFELLGDANGINEEQEIYQSIQAEDLRTFANQLFAKKNGVLLKVKKKKMLNRQVAPKLTPIKSIEFSVPEMVEIHAGIPLYWKNNIANETAKIELHFNAGTTIETPILASLTAGLLISGTKSKSAIQIHHALDAVGAYYDVSVSQEQAVVTLYALNSYLKQAFDIFHEALTAAIFPEKEVQEICNERQEKLKVQMQKVNVLAQRKIQQVLFEETPYSQVISQGDYATVKRTDLIAFHQKHYLKGLSKVFLVGDFSKDVMLDIKTACADFAGKAFQPANCTFSGKAHVVHQEKSDALQTAIRIGKIMFNKTHPDFISFSVMNTILGDYFGSRLMSNIREDKGYTYGIGSYMMENTNFGYFMIATEVAKEVREATIQEVKNELERLQTELVPAEELELVKSYLLGQLLKAADGPYAMLDLFSGVELHGMDISFYNKYIQKVQEITAEEIREMACKHLDWKSLSIISVG